MIPPFLVTTIGGVSLVTQLPCGSMDLTRYFTEWFPYYAWINNAPGHVSRDLVRPAWGWMFLIVTVSVGALMIDTNGRDRTAMVTR